VADKLQIDAASLQGMRLSLDAVARNFDGMHEQREELDKIWGTQEMRHTMGNFYDNWTTHRDKLRGHIEELAANCETVLRTFHHVDVTLSAAIRPGGEGPA
jgi:hypothetical protein